MLSKNELEHLLGDLESDRAERTTSVRNRDKLGQAVCAFANDLPNHRAPGYLLIGVRDDGSLSGLTATDEMLRDLAEVRASGNTLPLPTLSIEKFSFPEGDVLAVEVLPSDMPPVRYKGQVWVRFGPRRSLASEQDERVLSERRAAFARSFDARPCQGSGLDDLALDLFTVSYRPQAVDAEVIAENHRPIQDQLASLRFFDLRSGCPTNAGVLLFGKNVRYFLPGAYIQFVSFEGTTLADPPYDEQEISGDLLTMLRKLDTLLDVLVEKRLRPVSALRERLVSDYPVEALREILLNAVMHRDYEASSPIRFTWFADRIEIQSPGGLYGEATPENFPRQTAYRNPILAEALKNLGYVNRYGRGILRARALMEQNGNPSPEFEFRHGFFLATLRKPTGQPAVSTP